MATQFLGYPKLQSWGGRVGAGTLSMCVTSGKCLPFLDLRLLAKSPLFPES